MRQTMHYLRPVEKFERELVNDGPSDNRPLSLTDRLLLTVLVVVGCIAWGMGVWYWVTQ